MKTTQNNSADTENGALRDAEDDAALYQELDLAVHNLDGDEQEKRAAAALRDLPGVSAARIVGRGVWLKYNPEAVSKEEILSILREAGFDARLFQDGESGATGRVEF